MRSSKKRRLNERFHIPANAAKEKLQHSGFRVLHSSFNKLILAGPEKTNPKRPLSKFSQISLSQHKETLHLVADKRTDKDIEERWFTTLLLPLFISFTLILIAPAIHLSPTLVTTIIITVLVAAIALGNLSTSTPNPDADSDLALEQLLNQMMNQPPITLSLPLKSLQRSLSTILHCPYCRDDLLDLTPVSCTDCQTQIHEECWDELQRCPTLGCNNLDLKSLSSATSSLPQHSEALDILKRQVF